MEKGVDNTLFGLREDGRREEGIDSTTPCGLKKEARRKEGGGGGDGQPSPMYPKQILFFQFYGKTESSRFPAKNCPPLHHKGYPTWGGGIRRYFFIIRTE